MSIKKTILGLAAGLQLLLIGVVFVAPQPVLAQNSFNDICKQTASSGNSTVCQESKDKSNPLFGPTGVITRATQLVAILAGIAGVIMIIISGIRFITSSGDPNTVEGARNTLLYAVIGLVVAVIAQSLVAFVIRRL